MASQGPLSAVEVVTAILAAYNARDIEAFVRWVAADIEVIEQRTGSAVMRGLDEVRRIYSTLFAASPALHAELVSRVVMHGFIVDHERVTGRHGGDFDILITYQVRDGAICKLWFVREPITWLPT